jgi:hypothetical protein
VDASRSTASTPLTQGSDRGTSRSTAGAHVFGPAEPDGFVRTEGLYMTAAVLRLDADEVPTSADETRLRSAWRVDVPAKPDRVYRISVDVVPCGGATVHGDCP